MSISASDRPNDVGGGRPHHRRSKRWQAAGVIGLGAYLLVSISAAMYLNGWSTHPSKELFPFFSWSLFSKVRNERIEYSIVIYKLDDRTFAEPVDLRDASGMSGLEGRRTLGYKALQNIGSDLRSNEAEAMTDLQIFEEQYFMDHDVDYEVVRETFDPIMRWRGDRLGVLNEESVGRYRYEGRAS